MNQYETGYLQAIADADKALRSRGDDSTIRHDRKVVLALGNIGFEPAHVLPRPDWSKARAPVPEYNAPCTQSHPNGELRDEG